MKIITTVSLTAILTCSLTYIATKKYYGEIALQENLCPPVALDLDPSESQVSPSASPEIIAEMKAPMVGTKAEEKISGSLQQPTATNEKNPEDLIKAYELQQQHIESFKKFVNEDHKKPLIEAANDRYQAEAVNAEWALEQENNLFLIFSNSQELRAYIPNHMSCRSSTCKITIPVQDEVGANEAYRAAWRVLSEKGNTVTNFPNLEKGETVLYVSQQGSNIF